MLAIENSYLQAIRTNDTEIIKTIYKAHSPRVVSLVMGQGGTLEDAKDVFQDGMIILFKKVQNADFELTSSFGTYFYSVCKFVWWKKRDRNKLRNSNNPIPADLPEDLDIEDNLVQLEKQRLFQEKLKMMPAECQQVLEMFFSGFSIAEIAKKMDYTVEYAKRKKYKCKEKLVSMIKIDIHYKELLDKS